MSSTDLQCCIMIIGPSVLMKPHPTLDMITGTDALHAPWHHIVCLHQHPYTPQYYPCHFCSCHYPCTSNGGPAAAVDLVDYGPTIWTPLPPTTSTSLHSSILSTPPHTRVQRLVTEHMQVPFSVTQGRYLLTQVLAYVQSLTAVP